MLLRSIVLALRELMKQQEENDQTRDLAAYISLALESIHATIETSITAWEKRGYWLKADRFQMEWAWTDRLSGKMKQAVLAEDWPTVAIGICSGSREGKICGSAAAQPHRHSMGECLAAAETEKLMANIRLPKV